MQNNIKNFWKNLNVSGTQDVVTKLFYKILEKIISTIYTVIFIFKSEKIKKFLFVFYVSKIKVSKPSKDEYANNLVKKAGIDPNFRLNVDYHVAKVLHLENKGTPGLKVQRPPRPKWYNPTLYPPKPSSSVVSKISVPIEHYKKPLRLNYYDQNKYKRDKYDNAIGGDKLKNLTEDMRYTKKSPAYARYLVDRRLAIKRYNFGKKSKFIKDLRALEKRDPKLYKSKIKEIYYQNLKLKNRKLYDSKVTSGVYKPKLKNESITNTDNFFIINKTKHPVPKQLIKQLRDSRYRAHRECLVFKHKSWYDVSFSNLRLARKQALNKSIFDKIYSNSIKIKNTPRINAAHKYRRKHYTNLQILNHNKKRKSNISKYTKQQNLENSTNVEHTQKKLQYSNKNHVWLKTSMGPKNKLEMIKKLPLNHLKRRPRFNPDVFFLNKVKKKSIPGKRHWVARSKFSKIKETPMGYRKKKRRAMKETLLWNKTEKVFRYRERGSTWAIFIEQYASTIPIFFFLLLANFILAEALLSKFKCQQHYRLNFLLLNGGFLGTTYILYVYYYNNLTKITPGLIELPVAPINFLLYSWWFFLTVSFFCIFFFCIFSPTNMYLRGKTWSKPLDIIFNFVTPAICLLIPPIFIQKHLPFWGYFEKIIFYTEGKEQLHPGFVYLFFIIIFISLMGILFFYWIVGIKFYLFSKWFNIKQVYTLQVLGEFLFFGTEDNKDILELFGPKNRGLPYSLVIFTDDFFDKIPYVPTGYELADTGNSIYVYSWEGSYSRGVLLWWYFFMFYFYYLQIKFYFIFTLPTFFCLNFFFFIFSISAYAYYVKFKLKIDIIRKFKHKCLFYAFLVFIVLTLYIFRLDFMYFFGFLKST